MYAWRCVRVAAQKDPPNSYTSIEWLKEKWIWWFGFRPLKHLDSIASSSTHSRVCASFCVFVFHLVCARVCEIFFSVDVGCVSLAFGLFSNVSFASFSLRYFFPPFSHTDRSLTPSVLLFFSCVCASVRPNADTKYAMHCFQAFEKR